MDNTVIVDGQNTDLPLNLLTFADYLSQSGWNTSAYGKWVSHESSLQKMRRDDNATLNRFFRMPV